MSTQSITIDIPSDVLLALNETESEFKQQLKLTLAIRLYQKGKLTLGKSAQLCGLSRLAFENELAMQNIPISNLLEQDILNDIEKLR